MSAIQVLNVIASAMFIVATVPYVRAILRKQTKPAKVTWLIWASLDLITFVGMLMEHSLNGQITGAVISASVVAGLSFKYGKAGWTLLDKVCLGGAVLGVVLWKLSGSPLVAIVASLGAIFIASIPTFVNAWHNPENEDKTAWVLYWLSCLLTLFIVPEWTLKNAAQPIVFTAIESTMVFLVIVRPLFKRKH